MEQKFVHQEQSENQHLQADVMRCILSLSDLVLKGNRFVEVITINEKSHN